jgi:anhydro-N-acetylmuramic acid kinase
MSGTSLDGVDLAHCSFEYTDEQWKFIINATDTIPYNKTWEKKLRSAHKLSAYEFNLLHLQYGDYLGTLAWQFIDKNQLETGLIASHGHTIFHHPEQKLTVQIGHGGMLAKAAGLPVVNDFRILDIAYGGQGAPLVPIGDKLLFSNYRYCLNLGGFANISFDEKEQRIAFDICPVNIVLNELASRKEKVYDDGGTLARAGKTDLFLFDELNDLPYYKLLPPKSLGREWVEASVFPLFEKYKLSVEDLLHTFIEHIAFQISKAATEMPQGKILVTGGGAYNQFLIERISSYTIHQLRIPQKDIVEYKEALIFAFLGLLRWLGKKNIIGSTTGASKNLCSGSIHLSE